MLDNMTPTIPRKSRIDIVSADKIGAIISSHAAHIGGGETNGDIVCGAVDCDLFYPSPGATGNGNLLNTLAAANRYGIIS